MSKRILTFLLAVLMCVNVVSCSVMPTRESSDNSTIINPLPEAANKMDKDVTLYFRYTDEDMLAGEVRQIDVPVNERLEMAVLQEIFEGPSNDSQELVSVIPKTASVKNISDSGEYLFVTLSNEFISDSSLANVVEGDEEGYMKAKQEMELAIYSVVNTLIELGGFSRIQLMVDKNQSGRGERIKLEDIGFEGSVGSSLEPIGWNGELILNTENTVELLLETFRERDYKDLYSLIAYNDSKNTTGPAQDIFVNDVSSFESTLEEYEVLDSKVSDDGNSAIVAIDFVLVQKDGSSVNKENIILRLKKERNLWKVEYSSFEEVFLQE